jgi:apolipoprotein D and lipocalin family protein
LATVAELDVTRYMGTWYEIARLPHPFQKGCQATQAVYAARTDGEIDVTNSCHKNALDGPLSSVKGRARHIEGTPAGQLEVSFFRPFWSYYSILYLAPDYSYAVVGHPNRKYAWVLCRSRHMTPEVLTPLIVLLQKAGFDTDPLILTAQPGAQDSPS